MLNINIYCTKNSKNIFLAFLLDSHSYFASYLRGKIFSEKNFFFTKVCSFLFRFSSSLFQLSPEKSLHCKVIYKFYRQLKFFVIFLALFLEQTFISLNKNKSMNQIQSVTSSTHFHQIITAAFFTFAVKPLMPGDNKKLTHT